MDNKPNKSNKSKKAGIITLVLTPLALAGAVAGVILAKQPDIKAVEPVKAVTAPVKSTSPDTTSAEVPGLVVGEWTRPETTNEVTPTPEINNENLVITMTKTFPDIPEVVEEPDVVFDETSDLYTTERYGNKFYVEKTGDKYRVFIYMNSQAVYLNSDSGYPIVDTESERIGEAEFSIPKESKINGIIDNFYGLFEKGRTYSIANKHGNGIIEYITSSETEETLTLTNTYDGSDAVQLTVNTLLPLEDFPGYQSDEVARSRRSISKNSAWSGDPVADRKYVRNSKRFRKRKINLGDGINLGNPRYKYGLFTLKIRGTKYHLERVGLKIGEGYRIYIYVGTSGEPQYLDPKTGKVTENVRDMFFKDGSVYEMYQIAKKYRDQSSV